MQHGIPYKQRDGLSKGAHKETSVYLGCRSQTMNSIRLFCHLNFKVLILMQPIYYLYIYISIT